MYNGQHKFTCKRIVYQKHTNKINIQNVQAICAAAYTDVLAIIVAVVVVIYIYI